MRAKAVRLYGKKDLRFEAFELKEPGPGEVLARVVTDSLCMSSYKAMLQGSDHRCIPGDIAVNPVIMGHELCGVIEAVGEGAGGNFQVGDRFAVQPKMVFGERITSPGYTYPTYGGNATHIVIPGEVLRDDYVLGYQGDSCYKASMAEPLSCLVSTLASMYHLGENKKAHIMGLRDGGEMAVLAGCGPMGLGAVQVAMAMEKRPRRIVVTDIDRAKLDRARKLIQPQNGVVLEFVDTGSLEDAHGHLLAMTGGRGFDDILVMAPVPAVLETADRIGGVDCCINFFAGPTRKDFYAPVNFYDIHYNHKHIIGTSGGDVEDMREALRLIGSGAVDPSPLISHIGGLDCAADATLRLPEIPGGKKLIYCGIQLELTALEDLEEKGEADPLLRRLHEICAENNGLWCREAEEYLLAHGKPVL